MVKIKKNDPNRACSRCIAINENSGKQCGRRTCMSQYCWQHLKIKKGLKIDDSKLPNAGLGLFAVKKRKRSRDPVFEKNDKIDTYVGKVLNDRQTKKSNSPYIAALKKNHNIDARKTNSCAARYINDARNTPRNVPRSRYNTDWTNNRKRIGVKAIRNISNNDELLLDYGSDYWKPEKKKKKK